MAPHDRLSADFEARAWKPRPRDGKPRRRWFAMGDPQTTFANLLHILGTKHELLDEHGWLREDVGLVSIGDHFDFAPNGRSLPDVGRDGANNLRWLAEHPPDQVVILMGNHDAARVMELASETDEHFAEVRAAAAPCMKETPPGEETRAFLARYPHIPTAELAHRDYASFAEHQRKLVQELLLTGRMRLACLGQRESRPVVLTHAGIIETQVKELGVEPRAELLVDALEKRLRGAVADVRERWERDGLGAPTAPLELRGLHWAGKNGHEGGGMLYQRPSDQPDSTGDDAPVAPRKFDPRSLPRGLVQVCGHSGHHKCVKELATWVRTRPPTREHGGLRTLTVGPASNVDYAEGIEPARDENATLYLIDIEMSNPKVDGHYPLFELECIFP